MRKHHNRPHLGGKESRKRARRKNERKKRQRRERLKRDAHMTEKYGQRAHNMCGRKIRYANEGSALSAASRSAWYEVKPLRVYHCPYCNGWHLTSTTSV